MDETEGVYQDVSLSSCDLLTRIKATNSGLDRCPNALAIEDRSSRGFFYDFEPGQIPDGVMDPLSVDLFGPQAGVVVAGLPRGVGRAALCATRRRSERCRKCR